MAADERWVWVPFEVDKQFDGFRIDRFLAQRLTAYSRSRVQRILSEARVLKGGRRAKANTRVRHGDQVTIAYLRRPEPVPAADLRVPILFEDDHLLIVNKPANVLSHPTDKVTLNTVLALLRRHEPRLPKLHLLHRLDRETSGVLVLAKNVVAARAWTRAMQRHEIQKEYLALVRGVPSPSTGIIDWPIGCENGAIRVRQWVNVSEAVEAVTRYEVLEEFEQAGIGPCALVRCLPKTGRLHQIRVHLAAKGHPILGDPLYTGNGEVYGRMVNGGSAAVDRSSLGFPRVALHAAAISFLHPISKSPARTECPLPPDMADISSLVSNARRV